MSIFGGGSKGTAVQPRRIMQLQVQAAQYNTPIILLYGRARIPGTVIWVGDLHVTTTKSSIGKGGGGASTSNTTYQIAAEFGLCIGPGDILRRWQSGAVHGSRAWSSLASNWVKFSGALGQVPWSYLTTKHPGRDLGYSEIILVANSYIGMGQSPNLAQFSWEVQGLLAYSATVPDAEPTAIIDDVLNNATHGLNLDLPISAAQLLDYCVASGTFISPVMDQQQTAADWLRQILEIAHADGVWSEGELKLAPYYDLALTGNGVTYMPNLSPRYMLTGDDFIVRNPQDPIIAITRKTPQDRYNRQPVEFVNRANDYKIETAEAHSQADVDLYGKRIAPGKQYHPITSPALARWVAQLKLLQYLYVRNAYRFRLSQRFILLEPHVDIVALTLPELGLVEYPVRIVSITEDEMTGELEIEAEDIGENNTPGYGKQPLGGSISHDADGLPSPVNPPVFIEPTAPMTAGVPELWVAVSGQDGNENYAGCHIYYSEDGGNTYSLLGDLRAPATMGSLTNNLAAYSSANPDNTNTLSVDIAESAGELVSVSDALADAYNNLIFVDGEFLAFTTQAAGASPGLYDLTRLNRGLFGTDGGAHSTGSDFAYLGVLANLANGIFVWQYPSRLNGTTLRFKFTSYNNARDNEEDISTVTEYSHTIQGMGSGTGDGTNPQPYGFGNGGSWSASTEFDLGAIIEDGNNNGQQTYSIGDVEYNFGGVGQPASESLVNFPWTSGAVPAITQALASSAAWIGQRVALYNDGTSISVRAVGGHRSGSHFAGFIFFPFLADTQVGDFMVVAISIAAATTISPPAGWSTLNIATNGTALRHAIFYKVATASEPSEYYFTIASDAVGAMIVYQNVGGVNSSNSTTGTSAAPGNIALTPTVSNTEILDFLGWVGGTDVLTIAGVSGSSTPTFSSTPGTLTVDGQLQWLCLGPLLAYKTWQTIATASVMLPSKATNFFVTLDGRWAYANFKPGDKVTWQILVGSKVAATGNFSLVRGSATNGQEGTGTIFSRTMRGYQGSTTITARLQVSNGSGSGTFAFAIDEANLLVSLDALTPKGVSGT